MIKNMKWLLTLLILPFLAACGWEDLPAYEEAEITGVQFYYRWASSTKDPITNEPVVMEKRLNSNANIDSEAGTITVTVTVPAASNTFPADAKAACTQSKLWAQVSLSTAARLTPIDGSAPLGTPDDWTKPHKYSVMAADGTTKVWTITVTSFTNN
ncbi:MAG: hypothetical protein NC043_01515 [Muribaculaceae bacterium]|nr:hypothetical protein [Muribaculaceae bacterium]